MDEEHMRTTSSGGYMGFQIGPGMIVLTWSGNEFVFGIRWTSEYFGIAFGPFALGYFWGDQS